MASICMYKNPTSTTVRLDSKSQNIFYVKVKSRSDIKHHSVNEEWDADKNNTEAWQSLRIKQG